MPELPSSYSDHQAVPCSMPDCLIWRGSSNLLAIAPAVVCQDILMADTCVHSRNHLLHGCCLCVDSNLCRVPSEPPEEQGRTTSETGSINLRARQFQCSDNTTWPPSRCAPQNLFSPQSPPAASQIIP